MVSTERLKALGVEMAPATVTTKEAVKPSKNGTVKPTGGISASADTLQAYIEEHGLKVAHVKQHATDTVLNLAVCPFDPSHTDSAAIIRRVDGVIGFKCHHNSCISKTWLEVRSLIDPSTRPTIRITVAEHEVIEQSVDALAADPDLYQRGCRLVRVQRDRLPEDGIQRPTGTPTIARLSPATMREKLTRVAAFESYDARSEEWRPARPPQWLPIGIHDRGDYPPIRVLTGIADAPILRPDGSIHQAPGYDPATGVIYAPSQTVPAIPEHPTRDDITKAVEALRDVVCDFPFETNAHRSAWMAAVLTPIARSAYDGPTPMFLIDANVRGAGKGMLAQAAGCIALGRTPPATTYPKDSEELRKKITTSVIYGDPLLLLDNIAGELGDPSLDALLTCTHWKDRILGKSEEVSLPVRTVVYGTSNNARIGADTMRRIIPVRLDCLLERPEDRSGFKHPNLLGWVAQERPGLVAAALTILSGWYRAGAPAHGCTPFGSYEAWGDVVRGAIVWAGLPDPYEARSGMDLTGADAVGDALGALLEAWVGYFGNESVNAGELLRRIYNDHGSAAIDVRNAVETICATPPGKMPSPRQLGSKIRHYRRRVVDKMYLDINNVVSRKHGAMWTVYGVPTG